MMNNVFLNDVLGQPDAMRKAIALYAGYMPQMMHLQACRGRFQQVLFAGMGSSHSCSQGAVILLNQAGVAARMESASQLLHYESGSIGSDVLLVLTSQSGESGEIVSLIQRLPADQMVVGITNDCNSTLGRRANICLPMQVEPELAVSTRTYLASLILSDMTACALLGQESVTALAGFSRAVDALEIFLRDHEEKQRRITDFLGHPSSFSYIGRGYSRATAESGALFTRETAKYPALAFDGGEFRHGPYEMVDESFCAMLFAPEGVGMSFQKKMAEDIAIHGGRVVYITDKETHFDSDRVLVMYHVPVGERYAPLVQIAAPQLFANGMALYRGFSPGVFRQSSKVTALQ